MPRRSQGCNKEQLAMTQPGILGLPEEAHLLIAERLEIGDR